MKIQASLPLTNLKGQPYEIGEEKAPLTLGAVIAECLATDTTAGKMKIYALATKFYTTDTVEVDSADMIMIKKAVEENKSYGALILGQVLTLLEESK